MFRTARLVAAILLAFCCVCAAQDQRDSRRGRFADMDRLMGTIKSIEQDQLTLDDAEGKTHAVKLTPDTQFRKDRQPAKASDFKVGERVLVAGKADGSGPFVAQFVGGGEMRPGGPGGSMTPQDMARMGLGKEFIAGEVKKIDETKLTILRPDGETQVIEADENTSFRNDKGESVTMADIKVGDKVAGRGELKNGTFVPRTLRIGVQFPSRPPADSPK